MQSLHGRCMYAPCEHLVAAATGSGGVPLCHTDCPKCSGPLPLPGIFPRVPVCHCQAVHHCQWCSANPTSSYVLLHGSGSTVRDARTSCRRVWLTFDCWMPALTLLRCLGGMLPQLCFLRVLASCRRLLVTLNGLVVACGVLCLVQWQARVSPSCRKPTAAYSVLITPCSSGMHSRSGVVMPLLLASGNQGHLPPVGDLDQLLVLLLSL